MQFTRFALLLACLGFVTPAAFAADFSIDDYNDALPVWGTSWKPGSGAISGYYPSFYTGFAVRSSFPSRIHLRLARGNQTRVSVVLDEQTVSDYLFDLAKRYQFYKRVNGSLVNTNLGRENVLPQLGYFNETIESNAYGILPFVEKAQAGGVSREEIYRKGLSTLRALNPGRVFSLQIDLTAEFQKWKSQMRALLKGQRDPAAFFAAKPDQALVAINSVLFGRVNYTDKPSSNLVSRLNEAAELALQDGNDDAFVRAAFALLTEATGNKYQMRVLVGDRWEQALQCEGAGRCTLTYPEFTAIYPTGSVKSQVRDQFGNSIANLATPGLWKFLSRGYHEVDNIRGEAYYGWAPKMDYEAVGNGFHNPAVRFASVNRSVKEALNLADSHSTLWSVMRGGVSHGCSRLPLGHVWEMRHIFPVEDKNMTEVFYFGHDPRDFDVYDVDGDGQPEVMGVEYLISYGLAGTSELGRREGADLEIGTKEKLKFYQRLYGAKNVFTVDSAGNYTFQNPSVSLPSYLDLKKKKVQTRLVVNGSLPLYEQAYERDKVQFYLPSTTSGLTASGSAPLSKRIVRLMGRVRGCAPFTNKDACGEAAFDREAAKILQEAKR